MWEESGGGKVFGSHIWSPYVQYTMTQSLQTFWNIVKEIKLLYAMLCCGRCEG